MIENVIGVMGLPVGLGLNFLINGRDYVIPLVVEEPSIVAALSSAAKVARGAGGFQAESADPILIGQIHGQTLLYRRGDPPLIQPLDLGRPLPMVIGLTGVESLTVSTVTRVRQAWERNRDLYNRIFDEIDELALAASKALSCWDLGYLGELMNVCQGQLNALQVSSRQVEDLLQIAREHGAVGAKLTGGSGGGSVIALCPADGGRVVTAMHDAGYEAMQVDAGEPG